MSTELIEKADLILSKAAIPERHTYFQIEKFIIGKEPTAQSQLWAIARELQARKETIDTYHKDLADAEDNLELFDIRIAKLDREINSLKTNPDNDLNIQECEINIRKLQREKQALVQSAQKANSRLKGVLEETKHLVEGYEKIVSMSGETKPYDDEQAQKEMWNEKLLEEFNLKIIFQKPLDSEFIKTVMCLHDEAPVKKQVMRLIDNIQNKMISDKKASTEKLRPSIEVTPKITGK